MAKSATTIILFLVVLLLVGSTIYISIILTTGDDLALTTDTQASEPDPFAPPPGDELPGDLDGPEGTDPDAPVDPDAPTADDGFFPDGIDGIEGTEGAELLEGELSLDEFGSPDDLANPDEQMADVGDSVDGIEDSLADNAEALDGVVDSIEAPLPLDDQEVPLDDMPVDQAEPFAQQPDDLSPPNPADGGDPDTDSDLGPEQGMSDDGMMNDTPEDELAYLNQQGTGQDPIQQPDGIDSDLPETGLGQPTPTTTPTPSPSPSPSPTFMPTNMPTNTIMQQQPTHTQALPTAGFNAGIIAAAIAGITILTSFFL